MQTSAWWRSRAIELMIGLTGAVMILMLINANNERVRASLPATDWMIVYDVFVPDHSAKSNAEIGFDRVIKKPFNGFWVAEIMRVSEDELYDPVCTGSGFRVYRPEETDQISKATWADFIGNMNGCQIAPGTYRLRISWSISEDGWPPKTLIALSNIFNVTP